MTAHVVVVLAVEGEGGGEKVQKPALVGAPFFPFARVLALELRRRAELHLGTPDAERRYPQAWPMAAEAIAGHAIPTHDQPFPTVEVKRPAVAPTAARSRRPAVGKQAEGAAQVEAKDEAPAPISASQKWPQVVTFCPRGQEVPLAQHPRRHKPATYQLDRVLGSPALEAAKLRAGEVVGHDDADIQDDLPDHHKPRPDAKLLDARERKGVHNESLTLG